MTMRKNKVLLFFCVSALQILIGWGDSARMSNKIVAKIKNAMVYCSTHLAPNGLPSKAA